MARATTLKPYPEDISEGLAHVDALSAALAAFGAKVRAAIDAADKLGDADTADLFTGISRDDRQVPVVPRGAPARQALKSALASQAWQSRSAVTGRGLELELTGEWGCA